MNWFIFILFPLISFGGLSLQTQVGQLFLAPLYERELSDHGREYLEKTHLGNVIYFGFANGPMDKEQMTHLSHDIKETVKKITSISPLLAIDQEGGGFNQLKEGFTTSPLTNWEIGQKNDPEEVFKMGSVIGGELSCTGITTCLAPVVDIVLRSECPICYRSFGSDPDRVTEFGRQMIAGLHKSGVHAVLKHFPGLGDTATDSHLDLPVLDKTLEEIESFELQPYFALKDEVDAVMVGHLFMPKVDPNKPTSLSAKFMGEILRDQIGFKGVVMTDSLVMNGVLGKVATFEEAVKRVSEVAIEAFLAGADLLILAKLQWVDFKPTQEQNEELVVRVIENFTEAVKEGKISKERVEQSVSRILKMKTN